MSTARLITLAYAIGIGAGCTDGYPTHDAAPFNPSQMSQAQRMQLMNELGNEAPTNRRWRYELATPCQLTVSTVGAFGRGQSVIVPLENTQIELGFDAATKTHSVWIRPGGDPAPAPVSVFDGSRRVSALQMQSLLQHTQRDCARPASD